FRLHSRLILSAIPSDMSVSLISCPHCNSWVLSGSSTCPYCSESISGQDSVMGSSADLPENPLSDSQEDPCPQCGVKVRRGVVRCWNCQAFMRPEIEQKYQRMQDSPRPVIYSRFDSSSRPLEEHREQPPADRPAAEAYDT